MVRAAPISFRKCVSGLQRPSGMNPEVSCCALRWGIRLAGKEQVFDFMTKSNRLTRMSTVCTLLFFASSMSVSGTGLSEDESRCQPCPCAGSPATGWVSDQTPTIILSTSGKPALPFAMPVVTGDYFPGSRSVNSGRDTLESPRSCLSPDGFGKTTNAAGLEFSKRISSALNVVAITGRSQWQMHECDVRVSQLRSFRCGNRVGTKNNAPENQTKSNQDISRLQQKLQRGGQGDKNAISTIG